MIINKYKNFVDINNNLCILIVGKLICCDNKSLHIKF